MAEYRKPPSRRDATGHEGYNFPPEQHARQYYQSAPPPPPPPNMAFYPSYPPQHQFSHPPYGGWPGMVGGDPISPSAPEGFHAPAFDPRYDGPRNAAAVTPETHVMPPAEFTSPPSTVKKRPSNTNNSLSPSKRVCKGKLRYRSASLFSWGRRQ
jgi:hypothetical protein